MILINKDYLLKAAKMFGIAFFAVFLVHLLILILISFVFWSMSPLVMGLDVVNSSPFYRLVLLAPYLLIPSIATYYYLNGNRPTIKSKIKRLGFIQDKQD